MEFKLKGLKMKKIIMMGLLSLTLTSTLMAIEKEDNYYVRGSLPYLESSIVDAVENTTSCRTLSAMTVDWSGNVNIYCDDNSKKYLLKGTRLIKEY